MTVAQDAIDALNRGLCSVGPNRRLLSILDLNHLTPVVKGIVTNEAGTVLDIWKLRHSNTKISGRPIPGAPALLRKLNEVPASTSVDQYDIQAKRHAGCIFLDHQTGAFLGETLVELREKTSNLRAIEPTLKRRVRSVRAVAK